jgi:hypothetical protein
MNEAWTEEDSERWLSDFPLPADFIYRGQPAQPTHRVLKGGYGKWLRETPYHRGLFALAHQILAEVPVSQPMPSPQELARKIAERDGQPRGQAELVDQVEDLPSKEEPFG